MSARDYTDVYDKAGLLTEKTVLGHAIHLSQQEMEAIAAARSVVAHCPTSNWFLGSGLMKLDQLRAAGIPVGLGSDVAAGPELNMWQVMRSAVDVQKARAFHDSKVPPLRVAEAFHLATVGGARALGKSATIGTLDAGKEADVTLDAAAVRRRPDGHDVEGRRAGALRLSRRTAGDSGDIRARAIGVSPRQLEQLSDERASD
jgi:guanine deaminase